MAQNDNNKNNNTPEPGEDIFEIMERYRAANAKQPSEKPSAPESPAPQAPPAESRSADKASTPKAPTQSEQSGQGREKPPAQRSNTSFIDRVRAALDDDGKKTGEKRPRTTQNGRARIPEPPEKPTEAHISSTALKNHFSDSASLPEDALRPSADTSLNIAAHLAEESPLEAPKPDAAPDTAPKKSGIEKVKRALSAVWTAVTGMSFLAKAVVYVTVVLIISAYLSYYVITIANDVFAFVKNDRTVTINVPEGATDKEMAHLLKKHGIINYDWIFELYLIYSTDETADGSKFIPGEKTLSATMNYSQIINELTTEYVPNEQISVTIPEGYTTDQIIDLLVSKGIGTREGYVEAINNYPYKHEFVVQLDKNGYPESRKYRLEGYLYPDTYFFYKNSEEYIVINKLLINFQSKFWQHLEVLKPDIDALGMTVDDIVTLASMIQAEAKLFIDFEPVSYVFHNRLSHPGTFPYLQSDATIQYVLDEHVEDFTQEQLDLDNPYNTYKYAGLPPGAICNPGYDALSAAIYPDKPVDSNGNSINAYYFVSNKAGKTYYAETLAQHERNKQTVRKDNEEYENQAN